MLFEKFLEDEGVELTNPITFLNLVQYVSRENLEDTMHDASVALIIEQYSAYEQKVRDGVLGKTATFWISVMDQCRLLMMMQYAVKTNNLRLFHRCSGDMANLFFAFDGPNYSR